MRTLCVALCLVAVAVHAEEPKFWKTNANGTVTIEDPELGFKLILPKGSQPADSLPEGFPYLFLVTSGDQRFSIGVQRLNGKIPRNFTKEDAAKMPRLPTGVSLAPEFQWTGLDLMAMRVERKAGDMVVVDFGAQIPLAKQGINLHVMGKLESEAELKQTLKRLLDVLTGEAAKR